MPEELLAERELLGYPGTRVQIHVTTGRDNILGRIKFSRVVVIDPHGETVLTDPDAYLHPFARGYSTPNES
jgi:hypothetical protein